MLQVLLHIDTCEHYDEKGRSWAVSADCGGCGTTIRTDRKKYLWSTAYLFSVSELSFLYVNDWFIYVRNTVCDHLIFPRDFSNSVLGYFGPLLLSHSWLITVLYNYDSVKQSTLLEKNLKKILYRLQYQISLDPFNEYSIKFDKLFRVFYTSVSSAFFTLGFMIHMHCKYLS